MVTRRSSIRSSSPAGSGTGTSTSVAPRARPTIAHPDPPMWNSGIATRQTLDASTDHSRATSSSAEQLALVISTPFGRPVVPEV